MWLTRLFVIVIVLLQLAVVSEGEVRLVYFLPSDRTAQADIDSKINTVITGAQSFYAGTVNKTFSFETEVYHINGNFTDAYYESESKWKVWDEIRAAGHDPSENIYVTFVDLSSGTIDGWCGTGGDWNAGGVATMAASAECLSVTTGVNILVHELGHAFGLRHDYRSGEAVNPGAGQDPMVASECAIEWLKGNAYFNDGTAAYSSSTTVEIASPVVSGGEVSITFTIADGNGLHQAQFFYHILATGGYEDLSLLGCQSLEGSTATATFSTTTLTSGDDSVTIRVINDAGNQFEQKFTVDLSALSQDTGGSGNVDGNAGAAPSAVVNAKAAISKDVNTDGIVNILDLVRVASNFGEQGENPSDVNRDGIVNIQDLVLVASSMSQSP